VRGGKTRQGRRKPTANCSAPCVFARRRPHIPVGLFAAFETCAEPGMFVGGVREHFVDQKLQSASMRFGEQSFEIGIVAEFRIDPVIVGDVVAPISVRRRMNGRKPHRIDAERGDVIKPRQKPREIADPVSVTVGKTADVNLVEDGAAPPGVAALRLRSRGLRWRATSP